LVARSVLLGVRVWGLQETVITPEALKETTQLVDEATLLNAIGLSPTEDGSRIRELSSFLSSTKAVDQLAVEGERWQVTDIAASADETLEALRKSLAINSSPGRIGRLLRAMPVMAASRRTGLSRRLGQVLGVDPIPQKLITAYGDAFCRRDDMTLDAVDGIILSDEALGPVALEMTARFMMHLQYDGKYLAEKSREMVINCLVLLIKGAAEKPEYRDAGAGERNVEEKMT
jgi:hypothetical protein